MHSLWKVSVRARGPIPPLPTDPDEVWPEFPFSIAPSIATQFLWSPHLLGLPQNDGQTTVLLEKIN